MFFHNFLFSAFHKMPIESSENFISQAPANLTLVFTVLTCNILRIMKQMGFLLESAAKTQGAPEGHGSTHTGGVPYYEFKMFTWEVSNRNQK